MSGKGGVVGYLGVSKTRKLYCILIAEVYLTNILPPVLVIFPLGFKLKYTNTLPLNYCRFNYHICSWVAAAATEKLECKNQNIGAICTFCPKNCNVRASKFCRLLVEFSYIIEKNLYITLLS